MSRASATLFLACALSAQDPAPAPSAPLQTITLSVDVPPSDDPTLRLDSKQVVGDLITLFIRHGIPVLPSVYTEGTEGAYLLEISPIIIQYSEGTCLLSVSERLSLLPARGAKGKEAPRGWEAAFMAAQSGEEGILFLARQIVLSTASHLVRKAKGGEGAPLSPQALAAPNQGGAAHRPPPDRPKPVEVAFSGVKVRIRPPAPPYPEAALEGQIEGTVVVQVTVDPDGRPVRAVAAGGPAELKPTALRYAMQWLFEPTRIEGEPRWVVFDLPLPFRLRRDPPPRGRNDP